MFRMKGWPVVFTLGSCVAMAGCGQRKVPEGKGKDQGKAAVPVPAITATAPSESKASNAAAAGVTLYSAKGSALVSEGGKFTVADKGASINPGTRVVSAGGAVLISNGVEVELLADLSGNDPMPVATSGLKVLKPSKPDIDFEFTIEPGRIDLENKKASGSAKVRVISPAGNSHDIELVNPGSRCTIESYGRFMPGTRFDPNATPETAARPIGRGALVVIKGEVNFSDHDSFLRMHEAPGRAMLTIDGSLGHEPVPTYLEKAPAWVFEDPKDPAVIKKQALINDLEAKLADKGDLEAVIDAYASSDDNTKRIVAVYLASAVDDIGRVFLTVALSKNPDVTDEAIVAIRHWLGSGPGRDRKFYEALIKGSPEMVAKTTGLVGKPFSEPQAIALIDLFFGFSDEQKVQPGTYKYLLKMLSNEKAAIRALASWYLNHMVPEGMRFGFNPTGSDEARNAAIKLWETRLTELKKLPVAPVAPKLPAPKKP